MTLRHAQCGSNYTRIRNALMNMPNVQTKCVTGVVRAGKREGGSEPEQCGPIGPSELMALCLHPHTRLQLLRAQNSAACSCLQQRTLIEPLVADVLSVLGIGHRQTAIVVAIITRVIPCRILRTALQLCSML